MNTEDLITIITVLAFFLYFASLDGQEINVVDESSAYDYGKQFTCPNCGEPFDGHECENCHYTE